MPAGWVVPLPDGPLGPRRDGARHGRVHRGAVDRAPRGRGAHAGRRPVLVLGATGGVGSLAVAILAARGHEVHASTGKPDEADMLRELGAAEILSREETSADSDRPLERQRWAGVVDPVGGPRSPTRCGRRGSARRSRRAGRSAASRCTRPCSPSSCAASACSASTRRTWRSGPAARCGAASPETCVPRALEGLVREVSLDDVDAVLTDTLGGGARGRTVVRDGPGQLTGEEHLPAGPSGSVQWRRNLSPTPPSGEDAHERARRRRDRGTDSRSA